MKELQRKLMINTVNLKN